MVLLEVLDDVLFELVVEVVVVEVEDVAVLPLAPVTPSAEALMFSSAAAIWFFCAFGASGDRASRREVSAADLLREVGEVGQVLVLGCRSARAA